MKLNSYNDLNINLHYSKATCFCSTKVIKVSHSSRLLNQKYSKQNNWKNGTNIVDTVCWYEEFPTNWLYLLWIIIIMLLIIHTTKQTLKVHTVHSHKNWTNKFCDISLVHIKEVQEIYSQNKRSTLPDSTHRCK